MQRQLWAIVDKKTNDITGVVMTVSHEAEVQRIVEEALQNPRNLLRRYPQDFTVLHLGNLTTGEGWPKLEPAEEKHTMNVAEMANAVEINYQRAKEEEEKETAEQRAYELWAKHADAEKAAQPPEKNGILTRIFGGK